MGNGDGRMRRLCVCLTAVTMSLQALLAAAMPAPTTSSERLHFSTFDNALEQSSWRVDAGAWSIAEGTYNNGSALPKSVSTINGYIAGPFQPDEDAIEQRDDYTLQARLANLSALATTSAGLVFNFRDLKNYDEIVFTPARVAHVRRIADGVTRVLASATYSEGGAGRWLDVELVRRANAFTTVVVNGNVLFRAVSQGGVPKGRLGVIAYGTLARFENVAVDMAWGAQPFAEDFEDGVAQGWPAIDLNNWTIANGVLQNFTLLQTNRVRLPVVTGEWSAPTAAVRAKLFGLYSAPGNVVGFSFGQSLELTFSRFGIAKLQGLDANGNVVTHTANIPPLPKDWFEVTLDFDRFATVRLNDRVIFEGVNVANNFGIAPDGPVHLLTHWTPGRFDRVEFQRSPFPRPYSQDFTVATPEVVALRGIWATSGGVLSSLDRGPQDLTVFAPSPNREFMPRSSFDFSYRARLKLQSNVGAVGLITHYSDEGEFYEALFTPSGQIQVNKHVQGTVVRQATGTHSIPVDTWFDVELRCIGNKTRIDVNGVNRLGGILQGQLREGRIGVITRETRGQFDNVSWREIK